MYDLATIRADVSLRTVFSNTTSRFTTDFFKMTQDEAIEKSSQLVDDDPKHIEEGEAQHTKDGTETLATENDSSSDTVTLKTWIVIGVSRYAPDVLHNLTMIDPLPCLWSGMVADPCHHHHAIFHCCSTG